jgi:DNA-binding GntR family transcriptional regulator
MDALPGSPLPYRTLRELVQSALMEDILSNRYVPGQRLFEGELAATYGVSRAPVREAVRGLEAQGLVRSVSNKGIVVSRLSPDEIREVYELRCVLEPMAGRLAASQIGEEALHRLHAVIEQMDEALDDPKHWLTLNSTFHVTFYEASERPRLCRIIGELTNVVEPYIRVFLDVPGVLRGSNDAHHLILNAARRHDGAECANVLQRLLEASKELIPALVARSAQEGGS